MYDWVCVSCLVSNGLFKLNAQGDFFEKKCKVMHRKNIDQRESEKIVSEKN